MVQRFHTSRRTIQFFLFFFWPMNIPFVKFEKPIKQMRQARGLNRLPKHKIVQTPWTTASWMSQLTYWVCAFPVPRTLAALCSLIMLVCPRPVPHIMLVCLEWRLRAGSRMAGGVQLTCFSQCTQRCVTTHCVLALCSPVLFEFELWEANINSSSAAVRTGARGLMHALLISFLLSLSLSLSLSLFLSHSLSLSLALSLALSLSLSPFSLQQRPSQTAPANKSNTPTVTQRSTSCSAHQYKE